MKLARVSAVIAAVAIAPAVLLPSYANAADTGQAPGTSVPDADPGQSTQANSAQDKAAQDKAAEEDRIAVLKMLADPSTGVSVREAAQKALDGTPQDVRRFLEVGQFDAHIIDDRCARPRSWLSAAPS